MINQHLRCLSCCCSKIPAEISENLLKSSCAEAGYPSRSRARRGWRFGGSLSLHSGRVTLGMPSHHSCGGAKMPDLGLSGGRSSGRGMGMLPTPTSCCYYGWVAGGCGGARWDAREL